MGKSALSQCQNSTLWPSPAIVVLAQFLTTWINLSYEILGLNFLSYLTSQNIPSGPEIYVSCLIHSSLS